MSVPVEQADRAAWGFTAAARNPHEIAEDISRLLALTKTPTVIAVDQLDTMFAQSNVKFTLLGGDVPADIAIAVAQVAEGILSLRDTMVRTLVVISVLPDALELLKKHV